MSSNIGKLNDEDEVICMGGDLEDLSNLNDVLRKNAESVKRINLYDNHIKRLRPVRFSNFLFHQNHIHTHTHKYQNRSNIFESVAS
mgnify:CR=1 FL=1